MKISKKSQQLMSFFTKYKYISKISQPNDTNKIIYELYNDILNAYNFLLSLKKTNKRFYNSNTKKINDFSQIIKPKNFNSNSFPATVRKHIDETIVSEISYSFSLFNREINIFFLVEEDHIELKINKYNKYVDCIIIWLYILNEYASNQCSHTLTIYLYLTNLEKHLPQSNIYILNEINVNTAFTTTCPKNSEIIVFRKEEWFKVFIHETFHNFGLDFSNMNNTDVHKCILKIFNVKSNVNLYESYTEFWAEIMNALFCSFFSLNQKTNFNQFLSNFEYYIHFERTYSFFQLVKTLRFMGIEYKDLYSTTEHSKILRDHLYKENTNVLSYYVIKCILINNYPLFLRWCKNNNLSILQFKKTFLNQNEFCKYIQKNYKTKEMLNGIYNTQYFLNNIIINNNNKKNLHLQYLLSNLRMSICELG